MCGIAGWITATNSRPPVDWDEVLLKGIRRRGPDDAQVWRRVDGRGGLVHSRLAIIGTASIGAQPMVDRVDGSVLVFNGEIYNYLEIASELTAIGERIVGGSDTEVLLIALRVWGMDAVARLRGMFAFAFLDSKHETLHLCRDRLGIKPLAVFSRDHRIIFASDPATIANALGIKKMDQDALACFLRYSYVSGVQSIFPSIKIIAPGTRLKVDLSTMSNEVVKYYDLGAQLNDVGESITKNDLQRSVDLHMRADVPFGILLSGGIDSGVVAALASRGLPAGGVAPTAYTFTFGKDRDESPLARLVCDQYGIRHQVITRPARDLLENLATAVRCLPQPLADSGISPYEACLLYTSPSPRD